MFTYTTESPKTKKLKNFKVCTHAANHSHHNVSSLGSFEISNSLHTTTEGLHTHTHGGFEKSQSLYVLQCRDHTHTRGTLKFSKPLHTTAQSSHTHTGELLNFSKSLHTIVPTHREIIFPEGNFSEKTISSSTEILEKSLYRFFREKPSLQYKDFNGDLLRCRKKSY